MPKTISVNEAKNKLSAMLTWAVKNQDEVIVESRGKPKAVILPYDTYEAFLVLRERERRQVALEQLEKLAATLQARNQDLSSTQAQQLADQITRKTMERMATEGKIAFK